MNNEFDIKEVENYYREIEKLFLLKKALLEEYVMKYDNDDDIEFINFILTRKIIEIYQ
jgi:hypothetical protein